MNQNHEMYRLKEKGKTLEEIGERFGLTRERVRQRIELAREDIWLAEHEPLALKLPRRVYRALQHANISIEQARTMNITQLIQIRNIGAKSAMIIKSL